MKKHTKVNSVALNRPWKGRLPQCESWTGRQILPVRPHPVTCTRDPGFHPSTCPYGSPVHTGPQPCSVYAPSQIDSCRQAGGQRGSAQWGSAVLRILQFLISPSLPFRVLLCTGEGPRDIRDAAEDQRVPGTHAVPAPAHDRDLQATAAAAAAAPPSETVSAAGVRSRGGGLGSARRWRCRRRGLPAGHEGSEALGCVPSKVWTAFYVLIIPSLWEVHQYSEIEFKLFQVSQNNSHKQFFPLYPGSCQHKNFEYTLYSSYNVYIPKNCNLSLSQWIILYLSWGLYNSLWENHCRLGIAHRFY